MKEALFKADRGRGSLHEYVLDEPRAWVGTARRGATRFTYETTAVGDGVFQTLAVTP